jgi:cytochrome c
MKNKMLLVVLASLLSSSAWASDDLAKVRNCMACHSVQNKVIGPAFKDVSSRYAGQPGAEAKLVAKVLVGGSGAWGSVPMPSNGQVSPAEAQVLVRWVLSLR